MALPALLIGPLLEIGKSLINRLFPDPAAAAAAQLELLKMAKSGELAQLAADTEIAKAQLAVNAAEASSGNAWVAGARPFIMWTCGVALAYAAIIEPIARFVAKVMYGYESEFPVVDTTITMQILFGLLGLGIMRSYDKKQGTAS